MLQKYVANLPLRKVAQYMLPRGVRVVCVYVCVCVCALSYIWPFVTPVDCALQAPLSMGFSRWEYCSGLPFSTPGDPPDPGIDPRLVRLLHWQAGSLPLHHLASPREVSCTLIKTEYCVIKFWRTWYFLVFKLFT